jgi:ribonuclease P protein component
VLAAADLRLPKECKLRSRKEFLKISREGRRLVGQILTIDRRATNSLSPRFGITASRRYGNAHERNRFKRLVREAFRTSRFLLPSGLELNVYPRQAAKRATLASVREELLVLATAL